MDKKTLLQLQKEYIKARYTLEVVTNADIKTQEAKKLRAITKAQDLQAMQEFITHCNNHELVKTFKRID